MLNFIFGNEEFNSLGGFLKSRRLKKGLSQIDLAEKMGISQQSITYYESDQRIPSEKVTKAYAESLGLEPNILLQLRTSAVLDKEIQDPNSKSPEAVLLSELGATKFEITISEPKHKYITSSNTLSSIDGEPLTEEELEKAKEYIRVLRIMKNQNTDNK